MRVIALVISSATRMPFLLVMFGVLGGLAAFGMVGLFMGPVILAVMVAVWREWLELHVPDRAAHVMSTVQQLRGGRDYDSRFGTRLRGEGVYADLLARRFALALKRFGFEGRRHPPFDCTRFVPPRAASPQGELF